MKIQEEDFILETSTSDSDIFWDLTFKKIINKGKDNERQEFKDPIYGIPFESALKRIVNFRILNKKYKDLYTLNQYIDDFKEECENLLGVLDTSLKDVMKRSLNNNQNPIK